MNEELQAKLNEKIFEYLDTLEKTLSKGTEVVGDAVQEIPSVVKGFLVYSGVKISIVILAEILIWALAIWGTVRLIKFLKKKMVNFSKDARGVAVGGIITLLLLQSVWGLQSFFKIRDNVIEISHIYFSPTTYLIKYLNDLRVKSVPVKKGSTKTEPVIKNEPIIKDEKFKEYPVIGT